MLSSALLSLALGLFAAEPASPVFTCICMNESCGEGALKAAHGKVYQSIVGDLHRDYGLSSAGHSSITGWTCAISGEYRCTCENEVCVGGTDGHEGEEHLGVDAVRVVREFHKHQIATGGWDCRLTKRAPPPPPARRKVNILEELEMDEPEPLPPPPKRSPEESAAAQLAQAEAALKEFRPDKALGHLEIALLSKPDEPRLHELMARALAGIGDAPDALESANEALRLARLKAADGEEPPRGRTWKTYVGWLKALRAEIKAGRAASVEED